MGKLPHVAIRQRALVGTGRVAFDLELSDCDDPDLTVVIDVYDLDYPVHPTGHLGWWKFSLHEVERQASLDLTLGPDTAATLADRAPVDLWVNPEQPATTSFLVHAVLRSAASNAIVDIDTVPLVESDARLANLRSALDRNWAVPRYAPAPYFMPEDQVVHLVAPNIFLRDGVGNFCLDIYRLLKQNGIAVRLHASRSDLSLTDIVEPERGVFDAVKPGDQLLYFYSTFDPYLERLLALPVQRRLYFHGVTAPEKIRVFDPELSVSATRALRDLPITRAFDRLASNSKVSAAVLANATGRALHDIAVFPPALAGSLLPTPRTASRDGSARLLTVCQLVPHKKVEDILRLFAALRALDPGATCRIVGRARSSSYANYLHWVERQELMLPEGAVTWSGSVAKDELDRYFDETSAYLSMSEDEGFGLPLLEAMQRGVPVVAFAIPAVTETLSGTGVVFTAKQFDHVARHLKRLLEDRERVDAVVAAQAARAVELNQAMHGREIFDLLRP